MAKTKILFFSYNQLVLVLKPDAQRLISGDAMLFLPVGD